MSKTIVAFDDFVEQGLNYRLVNYFAHIKANHIENQSLTVSDNWLMKQDGSGTVVLNIFGRRCSDYPLIVWLYTNVRW